MSQISNFIKLGENQTQDFKFAIDDQKKIARTLVAFANTDGGRLLIGVKDNGKVVGCNPEEEFHMIEGAAQMYCKPALEFKSQVHQEGFRLVLEVIVEPNTKRPYRALDEEGKWKSYFRKDDNTLLVNKILFKVWQHRERKVARPEKFGEEELSLLQFFRNDEVLSLSQLYRKSNLSMRSVDHWLALFVCWDLVDMNFDGVKAIYSASSKEV
jgi:predicted HTH transcriptional regulator|tara:strand:+ start:12135 stop:12770 length:636 start_codon:yes stop_codon:yes gene_type:complete